MDETPNPGSGLGVEKFTFYKKSGKWTPCGVESKE